MATKKRKDSKGRNLPDGFSERPDGVYMSRFSFEGKRYNLYSKDLETLKKRTVLAKADLQNGTYLNLDNAILNSFFKQYMETYKKPKLRQTTYNNDMRMWELYIKDSAIGRMRIKELKRVQIVKVLNSLYVEKGLAPSTIKIVISLLNGCLSDAVNNGIIARNPAHGITRELQRSDQKRKEKEALTEEQQERFIEFVKQSRIYSVYLPMFSFLLATGCRIGECTGITWDNIDLFRGEIQIDHTLNYKKMDGKTKFFITSPKTECSKRTIPMLSDLKAQLIQQKKYNFAMGISNAVEIDGYSGFVFATKNGKPYTNANINRIICNIIGLHNSKEMQAAEKEHREPILLPHFSAHNLRHTFCTRFCENTTDIKSVQAIMGHSDVQTTLGIYAHSTEKKRAETMNELEGIIKIC